ncbi:hypothetical protein AAZX31_09G038600 [Glycine max]
MHHMQENIYMLDGSKVNGVLKESLAKVHDSWNKLNKCQGTVNAYKVGYFLSKKFIPYLRIN